MTTSRPTLLSKPVLTLALAAALLTHAAPSIAATEATVPTADIEARATELAQISGLARAPTLGMIANAHQQGQAAEAACLLTADDAPLIAAMSKFLVAMLEPTEVDAALTFYRSAAGHKYSEYGRIAGLRALGADSGEALPTLTAEDMTVVKDFAQSPAGRKLISRDFGARLQGDRNLIETGVSLLRQCRASSGKP